MNRKLFCVLLVIAFLLGVAVPVCFKQSAEAAVTEVKIIRSVAFVIGLNEYFVNDQVPGVKIDTAPFIQGGRTYVPVRFLGNALGVPDSDIQWVEAEKKVVMKRDKTTLSMGIGKPEVVVNGQARAIDAAPLIKDSRTFLPVRYAADGFGFNVKWDDKNRIVYFWPQEFAEPNEGDLKNVINKAVEFNGKPEPVKKLESVLGITISKYDSGWGYNVPCPYIPAEPARSKIIKNKDKSYLYVAYYPSDGSICINIRWASVVPDIRTVTYDLSPIEKVLRAFFPDQASRIPELMAKAREIAEVTKQSNRFKRAPMAVYNLDGKEVQLRSDDLNFVSLVILGG